MDILTAFPQTLCLGESWHWNVVVVAVTNDPPPFVNDVATYHEDIGETTWWFWHGQRGSARRFSLGAEIELTDESGSFEFLPLAKTHPADEPGEVRVSSPSALDYVGRDAFSPGACPLIEYGG